MNATFSSDLEIKQIPAKHWFDLVPKYVVTKTLQYVDSDGTYYYVEAGFKTDLASVVRTALYIFCLLLTLFVPVYVAFIPLLVFTRSGPWNMAAVLHDKYRDDGMFLRALLATNVFPPVAVAMYIAVVILGPLYRYVTKGSET